MPSKRIDFKHVRQHADFTQVLNHFGIELMKDGTQAEQYKCMCPFHDDHKPSLKVNTARNIYNCFACDASGNILDFVMAMGDLQIRPAAKLVADICGISPAPGAAKLPRNGKKHKPVKQAPKTKSGSDTDQNVAVNGEPHNEPLTFELRELVVEHPFIAERGLTPDMISKFGLGIATRGMMKDRLVFPIHNSNGEVVAYCGRSLANEHSDEQPKYKQPPKFRKDVELFNWHRVKNRANLTEVVLVESFFSAVKMHYEFDVVSPMGRSLSDHQIKLLKAGGIKSVVLLFDGDDPGRSAVITASRQLLAQGFAVFAPMVPEDFKPHLCTEAELDELLFD